MHGAVAKIVMTEQLTGVTTDDRTDTETDSTGPWLTVGGLAATVASVLVSLGGYGLLPARMRIHWSLGGPYYGPEFAPSWVILVLFPLLVGALALGFYWLGKRVRTVEAFADVRPFVALAAIGTMTVLVATQAFLIVVNL